MGYTSYGRFCCKIKNMKNKFWAKPKIKTTWLSLWFGLGSIISSPFILWNIIDKGIFSDQLFYCLGIPSSILGIFSIIFSSRSYKRGERFILISLLSIVVIILTTLAIIYLSIAFIFYMNPMTI